MAGIITMLILCATIILIVRTRSNMRVRLAEVAANASPIVLHADAATGEVLDQEDAPEADGGHLTADPDADVPQMGINQTGVWATPS